MVNNATSNSAAAADGFRDGIRDIVQLQVEENLGAHGTDCPHDVWPRCGVELETDLEEPHVLGELTRHLQCTRGIGKIERDDQSLACIFESVA
jgi:hypothetical protein